MPGQVLGLLVRGWLGLLAATSERLISSPGFALAPREAGSIHNSSVCVTDKSKF